MEVLLNSEVVENSSLDEVNSVVVLNFSISDVDIDGVIETVVVDLVDEDIVIVVGVAGVDVSVEPGELIDTSDVVDGLAIGPHEVEDSGARIPAFCKSGSLPDNLTKVLISVAVLPRSHCLNAIGKRLRRDGVVGLSP